MEQMEKGIRVTGSAREKIANDLKRRYEGGESIRTLAADCGRSYGFVHRILAENGVRFRGRGGAAGSHENGVAAKPVRRPNR
jgi:hypothetical protein